MPEHHRLGSHIRRFLLEHVVADRNLSRNTQQSYRDAIRVVLRFMTDRHGIDPADLTARLLDATITGDVEGEQHETACWVPELGMPVETTQRMSGTYKGFPFEVNLSSVLIAAP